MKYGYCIDVLPLLKGDDSYFRGMVNAGFDFIETSLSTLAALDEETFSRLEKLLSSSSPPLEACNVMYPGDIRLTGPEVDVEQVRAYTDKALERASRLGAQRVVLGSLGARNIPEGYSLEEAYEAFPKLLFDVIGPIAEKHGVLIVIEPLRSPPANFIITVPDGLRVVKAANHPNICLLADTIHMLSSGEDPDFVKTCVDSLYHVHLSELDRALPLEKISDGMAAIIDALREAGYNKTMSFEVSSGYSPEEAAQALKLVKERMEG